MNIYTQITYIYIKKQNSHREKKISSTINVV